MFDSQGPTVLHPALLARRNLLLFGELTGSNVRIVFCCLFVSPVDAVQGRKTNPIKPKAPRKAPRCPVAFLGLTGFREPEGRVPRTTPGAQRACSI